VNVAVCPSCGFNGALSTPVVYHDAEKELLLTFVPPELALPRDEQEKLLGGLINQVVDQGKAMEKDVSLCGDMAADPACLPLLLRAGLRKISVAPAAFDRVKAVIATIDLGRT
jgi:hypothetical protein